MFEFFKRKKSVDAVKSLSSTNSGGWVSLSQYQCEQRANWTDWDPAKAVDEGFKSNPTVYACMLLRMESIGSVPFSVVDKDGETVDSPLNAVLTQASKTMTFSTFLQMVVANLDSAGNSFWIKKKASANGRLSLLYVKPENMSGIFGTDGRLKSYKHGSGVNTTSYKLENILHFKNPDPSCPDWGIAPMQAAAKTIDTDNEAINFNKVGLERGGISSTVVKVQGNLTETAHAAVDAKIQEEWMGAANSGKPITIGADVDIIKLGSTPQEMDFINTRISTRKEICTVFKVPPPMINILDDAKYNNIETARKIFWRDTMIPLLRSVRDQLSMAFESDVGDGNKIKYDVSDVDALRDSYDSKVDTAVKLFGMGFTVEQVNERLELGFNTDDLDHKDTSYLPGGLVPTFVLDINAALAADTEKSLGCNHKKKH